MNVNVFKSKEALNIKATMREVQCMFFYDWRSAYVCDATILSLILSKYELLSNCLWCCCNALTHKYNKDLLDVVVF